MTKRLTVLICTLFLTTTLHAEPWTLNGGTGQKLPDGVLEVTGTGRDSNAWLSAPVAVEAGKLYRFSMEASAPKGGGGCAPCGLEGFSRDRSDITRDWKSFSYVFQAPTERSSFRMRVGQWESTQTYRFRNMKTTPVEAIHRGIADRGGVDRESGKRFLCLGEGEMLRGGVYRFSGSFGGIGGNAHRVFLRTNGGFNSDRFTLGGDREIVYCFSLNPLLIDDHPKPGFEEAETLPFKSGSVSIVVNHYVKGECFADVSRSPDKDWQEIGKISQLGTISAKIPATLFPADRIFLRIRSGKDAGFQVNQVDFEADLTPDCPFEGAGETVFADMAKPTEPAPSGYSSKPLFFDEQRTLYVLHQNDSDVAVQPIVVHPSNRMTRRQVHSFGPGKAELPAHSLRFETKPLSQAPEYQVAFSGRVLRYSFPYHPYRDARFGYGVPGDAGAASDLWWAEPDWKISPTMPSPMSMEGAGKTGTMKPIRISAAGNDFESFQLVVNGGENGFKDVMLTVDGDLQGPGGATIPASNIRVDYVYYHFVHRPTDSTGMIGDWPDALPPLEKPIAVPVKRNQPFWTTVYVPEKTVGGVYRGRLKLQRTEGDRKIEQTVPFEVKVWNFSLPKRNTMQTAYGRSAWTLFRYHNCKTEEDRRAVLEMYHQIYADHRISVYDPVPLDPIKVKWNVESKTAELDFTAFDREMQRVVEKYHVTGFRLPIQGMGWGTFEERGLGKIGDFVEETPEYEAMFSDYVKKLESHLKEKGWLDMAYIYWFDEPEPKDYEFVAKGFARLKKYAPGLARMITEEPNAPFIEALDKEGVKIDIWCPVSSNFNDDEAKKRMELGEQFWWYVCTGPKAPFCTLFIDHPGTELRVWHWQAWQRNIVGSLVWESTYWTSPTAFPKEAQNPYEDPMGYVSGGPAGSKRCWGNGDGRFVYPPLEAAVPGLNEGKPVLKAPVSSIRWEMIREGVEDYEMLAMLRDLKKSHPEAAEKIDVLLAVPAEITSSPTEFTTDPAPLYQRRQRVAELIETLTSEAR